MFIDRAIVEVRSGKGGDGMIAFLHEKYMPKYFVIMKFKKQKTKNREIKKVKKCKNAKYDKKVRM